MARLDAGQQPPGEADTDRAEPTASPASESFRNFTDSLGHLKNSRQVSEDAEGQVATAQDELLRAKARQETVDAAAASTLQSSHSAADALLSDVRAWKVDNPLPEVE